MSETIIEPEVPTYDTVREICRRITERLGWDEDLTVVDYVYHNLINDKRPKPAGKNSKV